MIKRIFAGIDGGGTKTAVVLVDESGTEQARVETTTSNAAVVGHDAAGSVLRQALVDALEMIGAAATKISGAWLGLSGSDRPEDHRRLKPYVADLVHEIRMTNDAELILGALPDSVGLAIVSGTGSIAFGRNANGERARSGGWGQIIGDEGSGYDLARRMFEAYARHIDGRGPGTTLTARLTAELALAEPFQLIAHVYDPATTKGDLASLSRLVIEEANAGDQVANEIITGSALQLVETASAAARRLGFTESLPIAMTGGMLVHIERFRAVVIDGLQRQWPTLDVHIVDDPALTAARAIALAANTSRMIRS
jgi:N-acetylglucosamine kinase-like BadF-type ATPase